MLGVRNLVFGTGFGDLGQGLSPTGGRKTQTLKAVVTWAADDPFGNSHWTLLNGSETK